MDTIKIWDVITRRPRRVPMHAEITTCGQCGRSWDDSIVTGMTPAPSGRCPFEGLHRVARPARKQNPPRNVAEAIINDLKAELAAEKKLSAAISRDCNATALQRNALHGENARLREALDLANTRIVNMVARGVDRKPLQDFAESLVNTLPLILASKAFPAKLKPGIQGIIEEARAALKVTP